MRFALSGLCVCVCVAVACAGDTSLQKDINTVVKQGRGTTAGTAAWERLSNAKSDALPAILEGMNTKDTVTANWLRLAFDRIVERANKSGDKIPIPPLLDFVKDQTKNGRARRYALDVVDTLKPGTREAFVSDALDDAEFRFEAIATTLGNAKKADDKNATLKLYRLAFDKTQDVQQARDAAAGLELLGVAPPATVAAHLGFLLDWQLIGPFDGKGQNGMRLTYPPEKSIDLAAELDGQKGKVRWIRYQPKEPENTSTARHQALIDLREARLGNADDAVAFAYTEFSVDKAMTVEMRGAADDNFTVWVNGVERFRFEEWRNGVRHDRHRFTVDLKAGTNTVLVKIAQSAAPNPEPNWEFFLRVVDAKGRGVPFKSGLK